MSGDVAQADAQSDATISSAELPSTFVDGFHELEEVKHMKYREMPHYGLVSIISFGASGLGGMFTEGKGTGLTDASAENAIGDPALWFAEESEEDIEHAKEVVLSCLKAGVNLIDTAHWYGQGRSERLLGHALADVPRAAYYINTKIGRYEKSTLGMFDFSYEKTYQAALDSLKRLRVECVDSMQVGRTFCMSTASPHACPHAFSPRLPPRLRCAPTPAPAPARSGSRSRICAEHRGDPGGDAARAAAAQV